MQYKIKYSFYYNGQYSGLPGREVDEAFFNEFSALGYSDRFELVGVVPAFRKSDEELDNELTKLLAEKEKRLAQKNTQQNENLDSKTEGQKPDNQTNPKPKK